MISADETAAAPRGSPRRSGEAVAGRGDDAGGIVGVARLAEAERELVGLPRVHDVGHRLGRLTHRDRQDARGQGIERAAVADLLRLGQRA